MSPRRTRNHGATEDTEQTLVTIDFQNSPNNEMIPER